MIKKGAASENIWTPNWWRMEQHVTAVEIKMSDLRHYHTHLCLSLLFGSIRVSQTPLHKTHQLSLWFVVCLFFLFASAGHNKPFFLFCFLSRSLCGLSLFVPSGAEPWHSRSVQHRDVTAVTAGVLSVTRLEETWKHKTHHRPCARGWFFSGHIHTQVCSTNALIFRVCACVGLSLLSLVRPCGDAVRAVISEEWREEEEDESLLSATSVTCYNDRKPSSPCCDMKYGNKCYRWLIN